MGILSSGNSLVDMARAIATAGGSRTAGGYPPAVTGDELLAAADTLTVRTREVAPALRVDDPARPWL